jgi:branched-chain amino acid transport system permease protein
METLLQVVLDGMLNGMLYALVASGLCLIWGVMDVINFAHGEYLMTAMYVSYWLGFLAKVDPLISVLAGGLFVFILGALTYALIIRHTIGKPPLSALLATFGLAMLLKNLCLNQFTPNFRILSGTWLGDRTFQLGSIIVPVPQLTAAVLALAVVGAIYLMIRSTRFGWAVQATAMDRDAAELMGIDTQRIYVLVFGIGAYGAGMAVATCGGSPWPGILVGMVAAAVVAVLISYPCFKLSGHYFAIATFAIVEIFNRMFLVWYWVGGALGLDYPLVKEGLGNLIWYDSKTGYYYCALALFVLIFGIVRFLERHRFGYYLRAVREGQETAESLGVNSTAVKLAAMALSAALAALCGAFFVQYNFRVDPPMVMSLDMSMKFVLVTILGGTGTLAGPLLGAAVLIPLQEYSRALWGGLGAGVDLIVFGLLIIVIVIKQPAGITGIVRDVSRRLTRRPAAAKGGTSLGPA